VAGKGAERRDKALPKFTKIHRVRHSAGEMFDLVADVEKYPEFLPLCEELTVRSRRERDSAEILVAAMTVGYKAIRQTFTTQVVLDRPHLKIDVQYLDGPFRHLHNEWRFEPIAEKHCDVHFDIDYEFRSRSLGMLMGTMFDAAFRRFTVAFEQRADEVYA
jgi:coenzyme Q-binding protein COQ10